MSDFMKRVWKDRPDRQRHAEGDRVLDASDILCTVERVHPPEEYLSVVGPRMRGWRYTVRPVDGPEPHAYLASQEELRAVPPLVPVYL